MSELKKQILTQRKIIDDAAPTFWLKQIGVPHYKIGEILGYYSGNVYKKMANRSEAIVKLGKLESKAALIDVNWPY